MEKKKLLIVGGGNLCLQILKILAPHNAFTFYAASRDLEKVTRSCNLIQLSCLQLGTLCTIHPLAMDLGEGNVEENSGIISRIRPDIILNCASLQSWRVITQLPGAVYQALDQAQFGPWLPMHLAPAYELMRAVKHSGVRAITVNCAFPDAVNVVLDKVGMAPDTGIGNVANLVPATRMAIARLAMCSPEVVQVRLVAQHFFSHYVPRAGLPSVANYSLNYRVNGVECTGAFDPALIFDSVRTQFRRLGGVEGQFLTATSAVSVIQNLFADVEVMTHAPGPGGLPGGYPVSVGMGRVLLSLPYGLTRAEAIAINQRGQQQDGIRAIHADGSVSFELEQMAIMETLLGYCVSRMALHDVHQWAAELARKYQAFAQMIDKRGSTRHGLYPA
ncbi:MAG TPA: hypothetical protein VF682_25880 [Pseudomonas sp.]